MLNQRETLTLTASEDIDVGDASDRTVGTFVMGVEGTGWTGSIVPKGRPRGATDMAFQTIPYQNLRTLADVAAGTGIAADGLYAIRVDGLELRLAYAHTAGSVKLAGRMMEG